MSTLSTHALDTTLGRPAAGLPLMLEQQLDPQGWRQYCQAKMRGEDAPKTAWVKLASGTTNADGRCPDLLPPGTQLAPGIYRMDFDTETYHHSLGQQGFYPIVQIVFEIRETDQHYHVPLLLSGYGFSTYRGS